MKRIGENRVWGEREGGGEEKGEEGGWLWVFPSCDCLQCCHFKLEAQLT